MKAESEYTKQAREFLEKHKIAFEGVLIGKAVKPDWGDAIHDQYKMIFTRDAKSFSVDFFDSISNTQARQSKRGYKPLTAYDVLACITKSDPGTFNDFCADFGYDNDSIKALDVYRKVQEEWEKVRSFFSSEELTELQKIN